MPLILVLYKLKPGVTMEQYKKFSKEIDQVETPKQSLVRSFGVFEVTQHTWSGVTSSNIVPPYSVFELIDVDDFDAWMEHTRTPAFKKVLEEWNRVSDASTLVVLSGNKI